MAATGSGNKTIEAVLVTDPPGPPVVLTLTGPELGVAARPSGCLPPKTVAGPYWAFAPSGSLATSGALEPLGGSSTLGAGPTAAGGPPNRPTLV